LRRLLPLLCLLPFFAAEGQQPKVDSIQSQYIKNYRDRFFFWPVIKRRRLAFELENPSAPRLGDLKFLPNNSFSAGVGAHLFDVSFELTAAIPVDEHNQERYGTSQSRDLSAAIAGTNWSIDGVIRRYSGFYLSNPEVLPKPTEDYPVRPDITLSDLGVYGIYAFNKNKFSLWSSYSHSERQLKSAGSVLLVGAITSTHLFADSIIVSPKLMRQIEVVTTFADFRTTTLAIGTGYSYTLVHKKMFFNLSFSLGPAHHWIEYQAANNTTHYDIAINSYTDSRVAFGLNGDTFFGGISFTNQTMVTKVEELRINTRTMAFRMVVGYRIKERGFMAKTWRDFFPEQWQKYLK
jgi:hypothetical protein